MMYHQLISSKGLLRRCCQAEMNSFEMQNFIHLEYYHFLAFFDLEFYGPVNTAGQFTDTWFS